MKKTYYNPEVSIVEFKANDKTSLNALSAGGTNSKGRGGLGYLDFFGILKAK